MIRYHGKFEGYNGSEWIRLDKMSPHIGGFQYYPENKDILIENKVVKIGIGITNPSVAVEVNGNVKAEEFVGSFSGSAETIDTINPANFGMEFTVPQGGLGIDSIPLNSILLGNGSEPVKGFSLDPGALLVGTGLHSEPVNVIVEGATGIKVCTGLAYLKIERDVVVEPLVIVSKNAYITTSESRPIVLKSGTGKVGINIVDPQAMLDIDGGLKLGYTDVTANGSLRFSDGYFEGYEDDAWYRFFDDKRALGWRWNPEINSVAMLSQIDHFGIGVAEPKARLEIGSFSTNLPSIRIRPEGLVEQPIGGAIEYDGMSIWITNESAQRHQLVFSDVPQDVYSKIMSDSVIKSGFIGGIWDIEDDFSLGSGQSVSLKSDHWQITENGQVEISQLSVGE